MSDLQERLARLSPAQRALLMRKLAAQKNTLKAVTDRSSLPLSFSQQRLWFLDQFEHGSANYNIPRAYRIRGPLDIESLRRAFNEIVRRHESLRTTFAMQGDAPIQVMAPSLELEIPLLETNDEATLHKLIMADASRIFDLQQGPLLSAQIIRLAPEDHALLFNQHHIISDGWSMGVFLRELNQLYAAFIMGEPSPLAEPRLQYADYAVWQRQQSEGLAKQLDYWKQKLAAPPVLELPTDRPRPPVQRYRGAILRWHVATPLTAQLKQLAQQEQVTLFMLLMAVFQTLLYRYSGQEDFTVGSPIAGRNHDELEGAIGLFVNTLVLRADLSDSPTFRQLLTRVRETSLAAFSHQNIPFEKLVEELLPDRDMSRNPLFQVMFTLQNTPHAEVTLHGTIVEQIEIPIETGKTDLLFEVTETKQGLACNFNYNTDLFDKTTVERMAGHLQNLLQAVVANPHRPVAELSLLSEDEQRTLLVNWNDTRRDFTTDKTIHALFEEQVQATPHAVALIFENQQLNYAELNARANQLAHALIAQGVAADTLVAIALDRSPAMIIALLATLKAGGAYVPLDPFYPAERLAFMLEDSGAKILITQETLLQRLSYTAEHTFCLDKDEAFIVQQPELNPNTPVAPHSLAYVIYTSGSTGEPKGVAVEQSSLLNLILAMQSRPGFSRQDTLLAVTTVSFDIFGLDIYLPLTNGGRIVLVTTDEAADPSALSDLLVAHDVTVFQATPATWRMLIDVGWTGKADLKMLVGGEALPGSLAREMLHRGSALWNLYGPTETTIYSSIFPVRLEHTVQAVLPIGRPIANTQLYVLDRQLRLTPIGVPGELHIGGDGLARGYLNRPELTAKKFISNPFSNERDARLYKTGDLVRYRPDGNIEYLGRIDFQVKLRGFRIELGEIESVLRQHASVKNAVVILREDTPGDQRLVAYIVANSDAAPPHALTNMLKAKLPEYMVPGDIVYLEALPLTANGKIDRKSLPRPAHDRSQLANQFIAPRTPYEKEIARIWGEVMTLENIGLHDNFFELGGHSLLATRVISRINRAFGTQLPLRNLFESPTIAGLAQALLELALNEQIGANDFIAMPLIPRQQQRTKAPLSFAQQRLWFLDQLYPGKADYNLPQVLQLDGPLNIAALCDALNAVINRHEALRTTFAKHADEMQQHIVPKWVIELPLLDLRDHHDAANELQQQVDDETSRPFDLSSGPLLRAKLFCLAPQQHTLLVIMHHIVSDGWSMEIFNRELGALYNGYCHNRPAVLAELPVQYLDYAVWQRQQTDILQQQLNYWQQQLNGAPQVLELPTDKVRPAVQSFNGKRYSIDLPPQLSDALKRLAKFENATLFMVLLSAYQSLLHRYSGQDDILVGTPIAGRTQAELEPLIGFFVNSLVMRTRLTPELSFRQLLAQVRETALGAFSHQELPFEKLVETLTPQRDMSRNPLFQAMFSLQNDAHVLPQMEQLSVSSIDSGLNSAKFDLTLFVSERGNGLRATFNYASDLFDDATIERMAGHYLTLLTAIVENPDQYITRLPLLTEKERVQLTAWNATSATFDADLCIQSLFERQAALTPDAVALSLNNQEMTYNALNRRANQLAHLLIARGIEIEQRVALLMDRSMELLIAILAILKAGGAYLPLDPKHPRERLQTILDDAAPKLLLTAGDHLESLASSLNVPVLKIDSPQAALEAEPGNNPNTPISPNNLAYVLYTSGSTGTPKGVMIEHGSVINLACALQTQVFDNCDKRPLRVALNTAITFDASVQQWTRLICGDCIVMLPEEVSRDTQAFVAALRAQHADVLGCTPTQLRLLFDEGLFNDAGNCPAIVLCGGEAIDADLWRLASAYQRSHIYNVYGPTECTVDATCCLINAKTNIPNIGRPLANVQAYILDLNHQPVPIGIPGELWLGGAGIGRGYLNNPELTASSFISDPYANSPNARLYKTGDLTRYLPDGNIEYLGRIDFQIKLRGYRIELGEIESVLRLHPSVKDAVAIVREDTPGDQRLTAYVTPAGTGVDTGELRHILAAKLPEYMVPGIIVCLDAFPLTSSGKTDRNALPAPAQYRSQLGNAFTQPSTLYEKKIAAIWSEVMALDSPGLHDNFFELGGHSLLATRVISRINRAFGTQLPLRNLFESPTIAGLAQALLELALKEQGGASDFIPTPLIPRQQQRTKAPLSFAQQRLWFLDQLYPGKADYNLPQLLRLDGPLNIAALCDALNAVINRHEALRTTFAKHGDETQQHIAPELVIEVPLLDLRDHHDAANTLQQQVDDETSRPLDLSSGPLLRAKLFRLAPQQHTLLVIMHHIVSDGWSMEIFNRELGALYNGYCHNRPAALVKMPVQYLDYAVWQRQQTDSLQQQLNYWQQQLNGAPQVLELPTDKVRPAVQSFNGKRHSIDLPPQLSNALKRLAQHENATLFMVLLSAYQSLLHRYSGQDDILVGTPIAGRTQAELEPLIGFFVNSLVMRTRFTPELSFRQLLAQVRETALGAFSHQELPFEKLVETLVTQRDMSRNPLFQAMFSLQNDAHVLPQMEQLSVSSIDSGLNSAKFDLTLFVSERDNGLRATFNYASDLFDDATIERMADHYLTLLTAIVENPELAITRLPLLTEKELVQLAEWNTTSAAFDAKLCIQSIFERQAAQTPDVVALSLNEQEMTYRELNRRANRLAHYLIQQGVQPESRIAFCLERGIDAVVALLGIIKAGGAYLPLDASYPEERLRFMLEDSRAILVLTHNGLMPQKGNSQVIDLDQVASQVNVCDDSNPASGDDPERLLYVIYTSGSTGTPKGVEVPHRAVNRLVQNSGFANLGSDQVFLLLAPLSFDASTFELWGALLNGGRCIIYPERLPEFDTLARVIKDKGVTILWLTASLFNKIIDEVPQILTGVEQLLTGGEALSVDHIRRAQQALPGTQFINGYGPTENTTFTCCYRIPRPLDETLRSIPIGRPIGNTRVYVLDAQLQHVPVGVPGELYVGGAGLARGYQNRADLTAGRFVTLPFVAGEKLYKTGDLVRYLPGGNLEFLGRSDQQVKLRGFRIELGEIDAVLKQHPAVRDCLTMLREDSPGEKRLVAYVIPQPQNEISEQFLRQYLKGLLPDYMVPAAFVIMDKLPLTPNGKVDHKALPAPSFTLVAGSEDRPRNTLEFHLVKIWENVLERSPIGIVDNFFELGGHSLLAVKLFDQIEKHFGKKLPLDTLWFEGATIETLARILEREQETTLWPELVQIKAGGEQTPLFCIHTLGGNLFHYYELARSLSSQLPIYGLQARGVYGK